MGRRWTRIRSLGPRGWRWVAAAAYLLPTIRWSIRRRGFGPTAARVASRSSSPPSEHLPSADVARLVDAVSLVATRTSATSNCLVRSLALWSMLRREGVDAELLIGAEPARGGELPAHAWVEVDGRPVNDVPDVRDRYGSFGLRLPRLATSPQNE